MKSTLAEMLQHNAAMNRYPNQNQLPLRNIENYPTTHSKENNRVHGRNIFVDLDNAGEQTRMVMSQGSHKRKENSPKKKGSTKNTPFASPKKDFFHPRGSDNNQKGNDGKNKNKGSKRNL